MRVGTENLNVHWSGCLTLVTTTCHASKHFFRNCYQKQSHNRVLFAEKIEYLKRKPKSLLQRIIACITK